MSYIKKNYIYKTVQDGQHHCHLHADVYRSESSNRREPGILWIHGGGLMFGSRAMLPQEQLKLYLELGYTVISIDYRLAPETKLEGILEDAQAAYNWVSRFGPDLFGVDPDRLAVIGHSAGAYLALLLGFSVAPRPLAIVSFYGYGDITEDWCRCPSEPYLKEPPVTPEIAYQGVGSSPVSESQFTGFADKRWLFYLFCRQQGLWLKEIMGHDQVNVSEMLDRFCPIRNITQDYPASLLLHGDQDIDVPFESSTQMARVLEQKQVFHRLLIMKGLGHMFDRIFTTVPEGNHPQIAEAFDAVQIFLKERL